MVVRVYAGPMAHEIGRPLPDCSRCRRPDSAKEREAWGCDAAVDDVVFRTGCSACFGYNHDCPRCVDGEVEHHRCPTAVIESAPDGVRRAAGRAMRAYTQFDQRGVLPSGGGYNDQTPHFMQVVELVDHERSRWQGDLNQHRERERERIRRRTQTPRPR